jgi:hypothetical protein
MPHRDLAGAPWRTSSHSSDNGGECVAVADLAETIAVRDSKHPDGGILEFPRSRWRDFIDGVKSGELPPSR